MKKYGLAVVLLGLLVALPKSAFATGSECADVDQYSNLTVEVCYTVTENAGVFTLHIDTLSGIPGGGGDIKSLGWTGTAQITDGPQTEDWTSNVDYDGNNIDGFDNAAWANQATRQGAPVSPDNGIGSEWTFNADPGLDVVFHVAYGDNCSVWVASRTKTTLGSYDAAGCASEVPEPATLTLLGTGLIGIAGAVRRRMAKKA